MALCGPSGRVPISVRGFVIPKPYSSMSVHTTLAIPKRLKDTARFARVFRAHLDSSVPPRAAGRRRPRATTKRLGKRDGDNSRGGLREPYRLS